MSEYINKGQKRKDTLKQLILDLHAGGDLDQIKARFATVVADVSGEEIAHLEQELINEGLPAEQVKKLCDVHVSVFRSSLDTQTSPDMTPGHPVHTFKYENMALTQVLELLEEVVPQLPDPASLARVRTHLEQLAEVNKVYLRKENLLFPLLEKHGVSGPSSVMWSTHDEIRAQLRAVQSALSAGQVEDAKRLYTPLAQAIRQMFYKEERILYPTALKVLTEGEWRAIRDQSDAIGYALVCPGDKWQPQAEAVTLPTPKGYGAPGDSLGSAQGAQPQAQAAIALDTGVLSAEQINLLLGHLPLDVTYVDEEDTVRYFSHGRQERIFVRTPAIIGRKVQNCHPPKSIHIVERILSEMRTGVRETADFWIQMGAKFVYIRYVAMRDAAGKYRGCIEVSQDIAPYRALQGEQRLLADLK